MSSPKYWWYGVVTRTIAEYPTMKRIVSGKLDMPRTPRYHAQAGRSGGATRTVERHVLKAISTREAQDCDAIERAIERARMWNDSKITLDIVRLHSWEGLTFEQTAARVHLSEQSAKMKHRRFVYAVAKEMGYED